MLAYLVSCEFIGLNVIVNALGGYFSLQTFSQSSAEITQVYDRIFGVLTMQVRLLKLMDVVVDAQVSLAQVLTRI